MTGRRFTLHPQVLGVSSEGKPMDTNGQAVTKTDLNAGLQDLEARLKSHFAGQLDASEQRMLDKVSDIVRDAETRILQAFYGFTESSKKRMGQMEVSDAVLVSRLGTLEDRLTEVEKRLNIPPSA